MANTGTQSDWQVSGDPTRIAAVSLHHRLSENGSPDRKVLLGDQLGVHLSTTRKARLISTAEPTDRHNSLLRYLVPNEKRNGKGDFYQP